MKVKYPVGQYPDGYPTEAGWIFSGSLGKVLAAKLIIPSIEEYGQPLIDAIIGFSPHDSESAILRKCKRDGYYENYDDCSESIVFDYRAYHRWMISEVATREDTIDSRTVIEELAPWASSGLSDPSVCDELRAVFQRVLDVKGQNDREFERWARQRIKNRPSND